MLDPKKSYLVPFDPDNTSEPFGLMRAEVDGIDQWWLVQVWADGDPDETVMVRFIDQDGPGGDTIARGYRYSGCPWFPIEFLSDEVPRRYAPQFRLQMDFPEGLRITHEWGEGASSDAVRESVLSAVEDAIRGTGNG